MVGMQVKIYLPEEDTFTGICGLVVWAYKKWGNTCIGGKKNITIRIEYLLALNNIKICQKRMKYPMEKCRDSIFREINERSQLMLIVKHLFAINPNWACLLFYVTTPF